MVENYKRTVTHTSYKHGNKKVKKGGISRMIPLRITHKKLFVSKEEYDADESIFSFLNSKYMIRKIFPKILPIWGGGAFLILFLFSVFVIFTGNEDEKITLPLIAFVTFFFLGFSFFTYYYITMPKKECIYNREDGLVTFPGFMWHKNITMPIHTILFSKSSPSAQGLGAGCLEIIRPDKTYSLYSLGASMYYEDLSFLLWYMDKNRPLPRGDAFDEFRQADFERRKAEGFPKPLFPADFETPEATPEQQAERERIGGW